MNGLCHRISAAICSHSSMLHSQIGSTSPRLRSPRSPRSTWHVRPDRGLRVRGSATAISPGASRLRVDFGEIQQGHVCSSVFVCVCPTLDKGFFHHLRSTSRGPAHDITTLANEASDVMGCGQRRLTVYLPGNCCSRCPLFRFVSWCFM